MVVSQRQLGLKAVRPLGSLGPSGWRPHAIWAPFDAGSPKPCTTGNNCLQIRPTIIFSVDIWEARGENSAQNASGKYNYSQIKSSKNQRFLEKFRDVPKQTHKQTSDP